MAAPQVGVVGMAALRRDINRLSTDQQGPLYAAIRAAGKQAAEPIASVTRSTIPMGGTGNLAGTVRTSGTKTGAAVRMGTARVPYAGWLDFGGTRPDGSSRDYRPDGRYLFPAAQGRAGQAAQLYADALERVFSSDSVWTNSTTDPGSVHD